MPTTSSTRRRTSPARETSKGARAARASTGASSSTKTAKTTKTAEAAEAQGARPDEDRFVSNEARPQAGSASRRQQEGEPTLRGGVSVVGARLWTPPARAPRMAPVNILDVRPAVNGGDFALKRIQGDTLRISADILKEGHDKMRARVVYGEPGQARHEWSNHVEMTYSPEHDEWSADVPLTQIGEVGYAIEAWTDRYGTAADELSRKAKAGENVHSELLEMGAFLKEAAKGIRGGDRKALLGAAALVEDASVPMADRVEKALSQDIMALMQKHERPTDLSTSSKDYRVKVERERARFGAWYELSARSASFDPNKPGTLQDVRKRLPEIAKMGFDVLYLLPVHPIGEVERKGKNNAPKAGPGDPGSLYAIGSKDGGHRDIHPELGTMKDFEELVRDAGKHGLEIAMDFAVQTAPDHPWTREHPEWFRQRPDGTIKYAENPPKKYTDIVQLDAWGEAQEEIWNEVRDTLLHWIDKGVKIFRVDNPHTKPPAMWEQVIHEVHEKHPDVVFLSEAFAKPKTQELFTKLGFSQTYTYFTWKNTREELLQFMRENVLAPADHSRPNMFMNTPDILPKYLQDGGPAHFKVRYGLAGTLSGSVGIFQGAEFCENEALKGEEYLNSDKYEARFRDWSAPNIRDFITKVNQIRRENPALHDFKNFVEQYPDNGNVMAYSKVSQDGDNKILVVANLDPHHTQEATLHLDGRTLGLDEGSRYVVHDLLTGEKYDWQGLHNYVKLDPSKEPMHIFRIEQA